MKGCCTAVGTILATSAHCGVGRQGFHVRGAESTAAHSWAGLLKALLAASSNAVGSITAHLEALPQGEARQQLLHANAAPPPTRLAVPRGRRLPAGLHHTSMGQSQCGVCSWMHPCLQASVRRKRGGYEHWGWAGLGL